MKIVLCIFLVLLVIILPFAAVIGFAVSIPPQYSDTFVGELDEKFERLNSIDEPKIVVVGGSSVAFGLDSELLMEYTGMPVVNFGLYAALGTKLMLDLSKSGINKGDVVIISPEMDAQTLSLYFSSETTLKAIDDDFSMFFSTAPDNWFNLLGGMWKFASDKWERYQLTKDLPPRESDDVYQSKYFDEYCDFDYPRSENVMDGYFDPNTPIYLNDTLRSEEYLEFVEYLNSYINALKRKGASVYFSYCPMNALALTDTTEESKAALDAAMREDIDCEFISEIDSCIFEAGYFFDTNFHLNDAGVIARTISLAKDIKLAHGITEGVITDEIPTAPALPGKDVIYDGVDENAKYFTFEKNSGGSYTITGLSELGKTMTTLTVPLGYDGVKVTLIGEGAFSGSSLEKLIITADSNITRIKNGAFTGASALSELWIYKPSGDYIGPPSDFLGVADAFKVHVPLGSDFSSHYYWSERGLSFVFDAN